MGGIMNKFLNCFVASLFLGLGIVTSVNAETAKGKTPLENLQAAFNGETNAKAKYEAYAAKANEEGYKSVAALFRAAALSESVHARKHGAVIEKEGAKPNAVLNDIEVKSTRENLEAALKGESYEMETMYPEFLKQAEKEKNAMAVRTFRGAMMAEKEHARFYALALKELDAWRAPGKVFLVCEVCGYTSMDMGLKKCPVCAAPRSKFEEIE